MAYGRGTAEGNYEITIEGIGFFRASRVSGGNARENEVSVPDGERVQKVPGPLDFEDLTLEVPVGQYEAVMAQISAWRDDIALRRAFVTRSIYRDVMDAIGQNPIKTFEHKRGWPKSFDLSDAGARGDGPATYTIVFCYEDIERY
jgi:hypothetical protein